jgi:two-component system response regulator NreC
MRERIRVLIADDHTIFRSGLNMLLSSQPDIDVVGEATDGDESVAAAVRLRPDVVLMDIGMPRLNGIEATRQIRERVPETEVLVLTMHRSDEYFFQMLEAGASGYILKGAETRELISAVRTVSKGEVFLYPSLAGKLVKEYLKQINLEGEESPLSERERQILKLVAKGFTSKEIAERLVISPSTVHSHRTNIMHKLEFKTRHELVRYARQRGLL